MAKLVLCRADTEKKQRARPGAAAKGDVGTVTVRGVFSSWRHAWPGFVWVHVFF